MGISKAPLGHPLPQRRLAALETDLGAAACKWCQESADQGYAEHADELSYARHSGDSVVLALVVQGDLDSWALQLQMLGSLHAELLRLRASYLPELSGPCGPCQLSCPDLSQCLGLYAFSAPKQDVERVQKACSTQGKELVLLHNCW